MGPVETDTATATATATATPTPSPTPTSSPADSSVTGSGDGSTDFTLAELRSGGDQPGNSAPQGVRILGRSGAVAIEYKPAQPFGGERTFLTPGTTLNTNDISLRSTRFGSDIEPRDVTLHIVYYQPGTRTVNTGNGTTTKQVPVNVSHQKVDVTLGTGYAMANISLWPHYDEAAHMSMWLTDASGEKIDGVRWTNLKHRSDPAAAPAANISDKGDLWGYVLKNAFAPAIVGLLVAFGVGRHVLSKIGTGPNLGVTTYGILVTVGAFTIGAFLYMFAGTVLTNIPIIWGVLVALIGFLGYIEVGGARNQRFLFEQDVLEKATSPSGDEVADTVYQRVENVVGHRREDGSIGLPATGIRPAIARYFAEPATLDDLDVETRVTVSGDFDEKFIGDPESDDVLVHTPAYLEFDPTLIEEPDDVEPGTQPDSSWKALLGRVNWSFIVASITMVGVGWFGAGALLGFPSAGLVAAGLGIWALGTKARDGNAEFVPAPVHMRSAKATTVNMAVEYDDAKTIDEADRARYKAEARTAGELRDREADRAKVTSQKLAERAAGVSFGPGTREDREGPAPIPEDGTDRRQDARADGGDADDEDDEPGGGVWRDA